MSQIVKLENNDVQYVFDNTELVVDPSDLNEDIIYSDGTRAILVNGQILQGDGQTIVLQEGDDLTQYYVNDDCEQIFIADNNELTATTNLEDANIVQYIEEDDSQGGQVVYITNEDEFVLPQDICQTYQVQEQELKCENEVLDIDDIIQQQNNEASIIENSEEYQYAVLKDGKWHIQYDPNQLTLKKDSTKTTGENPPYSSLSSSQILDLSRITGKNLLTGQTVTLYNYIDKLQKRNKEIRNVNSNSDLKSLGDINTLLNKKIPICKTLNGKKLIGKVIHVEKNMNSNKVDLNDDLMDSENIEKTVQCEQNFVEEINDESVILGNADLLEASSEMMDVPEQENTIEKEKEDMPEKCVVRTVTATKEEEEQISRTLAGIMLMDSVKKKLIMKNIFVKLLEKSFNETKELKKRVIYSYGYMEERTTSNQEECWTFVPEEISENKDSVFIDTVHITIQMTIMSNGERQVKVILNDDFECKFCLKKFSNQIQARTHSKICPKQGICIVCEASFESYEKVQEHFKLHEREGKCVCMDCGKIFPTVQRLKRHKLVHSLAHKSKTLECSTCLHRCSNESSLKKHMLTHMNVKLFHCNVCSKKFTNLGDLNYHKRIHDVNNYFQCDTCGRSFSRYSNLMRHIDIHKGGKSLYQCDICGSSYNYISSLTRHVVQNHINKDGSAINENIIENS